MVEIVGWVERMHSVGNFGLCYICMYLCKYCDRIVPWNSLVHFLASSHLLTKAGERGTVGHTTNLFTGSRSQEDKRSGHCHCKEQEPLKIVERSNNDSDKLLEKKIFLYICDFIINCINIQNWWIKVWNYVLLEKSSSSTKLFEQPFSFSK